jgi:hypothetical protein
LSLLRGWRVAGLGWSLIRKKEKMFTQGKWETKMGGRQIFAGKKHIATAHYAGNPVVDIGEANDNAQLIIAAPTLLEACKMAACHIELIGTEHKILLDNAIAKAEGKI